MQHLYIGSSLTILFSAKNASGQELDISTYEKKIFVSSGNFKRIEADITSISNSSFNVSLTGEHTKQLGSGLLQVVVELTKGEDKRIGKTTPLTLISPNSSNGCQGNTIILDKGCVNASMTISNTQISVEMTMGSTLVYEGVDPAEIPTKVSELENDSEFITLSEVPEFPKKLSQFENDENFITSQDIPSIPKSTNELENNSGFITADDIPVIPNDTSQLTNGAGFITIDEIPKPSFEQANKTFIDLWDMACGTYGKYNATSGLFELNGITNLSHNDALRIFLDTVNWTFASISTPISSDWRDSPIRTNLPLRNSIFQYGTAPEITGCIISNTIEVLCLASLGRADLSTIRSISNTSFQLPKTKKILGNILIYGSSSTLPINITTNLGLCETINLNIAQYTPSATSNAINIKGMQLISLASLSYLVNSYPTGRNQITVTVHADIYAKLTNTSLYPEWAALVTVAQSKNITFAV